MLLPKLPTRAFLTTINPFFRPLSRVLSASVHTNSAEPLSEETPVLINRWRDQVLPRSDHSYDLLTPSTFNLLAITLDHSEYTSTLPPYGTPLPPNWHLAYFPSRIAERDLAPDGYEKAHMPPDPFVQRMWAGGSIEFNKENLLRIGQDCQMITRCKDVEMKKGRSGESVFVWVEKTINNDIGWAVKDTRCLVYMKRKLVDTSNSEPRIVKATKSPTFTRTINPTTILLFRYSALTFNSHLIHYDRHYATKLEGHPGCLVHGPLNATLLLHLLSSNIPKSSHIQSFTYRALSPLYAGEEYKVCGREGKKEGQERFFEMWAEGPRGLAMSGTALVVD